MNAILYIRSTFKSYNMWLRDKNGKIIFFNHGELTTYSKCSQSEELQNLSIAATSLLIEQSLNNNIDSFEIKYVGPLRFSMLNDVLLDAYGINISLIKDKTPIPHNLCFQQRSRKMRLL